eukprot:TRINITY_DN3381_c0_g1_i3.p1 TRINITY_DN3381_c0_g1~~TRINITY_DN3381_c0_g1_i3.p1  ORF type:complete len:110 (+),score=0.99 TRINITY_DN3381_c0_g1_i3:194-523(+)
MSPLIAVSRDVWRHAGVRRAEATGSRCRSGGMMKQILGGMDQLSKKAQSDPSAMCSMQSFSYARKTGPDNKPHVVQKCSSMRRAKGVIPPPFVRTKRLALGVRAQGLAL